MTSYRYFDDVNCTLLFLQIYKIISISEMCILWKFHNDRSSRTWWLCITEISKKNTRYSRLMKPLLHKSDASFKKLSQILDLITIVITINVAPKSHYRDLGSCFMQNDKWNCLWRTKSRMNVKLRVLVSSPLKNLTLLRGGLWTSHYGGWCNFASPWISQQLQMLEHGNLVRICTKIMCIGISC